MWMCVLLGRSPMRRPASVADAVCSVERMKTNALFEISQLAFGTAQLEMMLLVRDGDTGRIVSAILQLSKPVDYQRNDLFITYVTYNSTHINKATWTLL